MDLDVAHWVASVLLATLHVYTNTRITTSQQSTPTQDIIARVVTQMQEHVVQGVAHHKVHVLLLQAVVFTNTVITVQTLQNTTIQDITIPTVDLLLDLAILDVVTIVAIVPLLCQTVTIPMLIITPI